MATFDLGKIRATHKGDWLIGTSYEYLDVVRYGGNSYMFTNTTAATGSLPTDATKWSLLNRGIKSMGAWSNATSYKVGETVMHGPRTFIAIADNTDSKPPSSNWTLLTDGLQYGGTYAGGTSYQIGDLVKYGGNLYYCFADSLGNVPSNTSFWVRVVAGFTYRGAYANATVYFPGEVVTYGGALYTTKLVSFTSGAVPPSDTTNWDTLLTSAGYGGTSPSSLAIGTGAKAFVTQLGLAYNTASRVRASSAANPANFMEGVVASNAGGTLTLTVDTVGGSGTFADWVLSIASRTNVVGTAVLVGGTVVVNNATVAAGSIIMLTSQVDGGTPGWLRVSARSNGVSFTITSSSGSDTSTVGYEIIQP